MKEFWTKLKSFLTVWSEDQMAAHLNKTGRYEVKKK